MKITTAWLLGLFMGGLGLVSHPAQARWATPDDAEAVVENLTREVEVHKDGSHVATSEHRVRVLREGARTLSNYRLSYNSRVGHLKVLEAETLNGDKRFPVESEFIEDKPQASREHGFDEFNLVTVAFPKVEIGSVLHVRYRDETREVPLPNHYAARFDIGQGWYVKNELIHVRSEMPLFFESHDPQSKLEITQAKNGDSDFELTIRLKAPLFTRAVDEPWVAVPPKDQTYVVLSSTKTFPEMALRLADRYEEVLDSPLPALYQTILEHARARHSMVDRLNTITSELATQVRYLGDWRPVRGGHVPRPLETVAATKFGDCKDFSAATVSILRKLGVKANVAWVERAVKPTPLPTLAYDGAFNHAIVWANAEGRDWWIDPTNFVSFAQGLFPDIIDREALIVDPKAPRLARIPEGKATESLRESVGRIRLDRSGDAEIDAQLSFGGRDAQVYAGATLKQSKEHVDHYLITSLVDENRLKWKAIDDYELNSRIAGDFKLHLRWGETQYSMRTTAGPAFYLGTAEIDTVLRLDTKNRVSDLFLGQPDTFRSIDTFVDVHALGAQTPACRLDSPWMSVSRAVSQTPQGLRIVDTRVIKKSLISNDELKGETFRKFQDGLLKCFDRVAIVYERLAPGKPRAISSVKER